MDPVINPPRIVGRYAVFDVIASGGMAAVHLGRLMGPAGFSRTVAIKRLHENFARDPEFVAMFMDEARLVARIRHPNVVPTLDIVALDPELLIVMEYVAGEALSYLLKHSRNAQTPVPIPVIVDIAISVLNGLHAAHEATNEKGEPLNIIHRDVSPQNILIGTDGVARVLDFGVAKAVGRMHQTRAGQVKGKIHYMPPEQLTGKGVTRAADVYSVAAVLWEALTSKRMFTGESDAEIMYALLLNTPQAPSELRHDVPPALDAIVQRGLQKDPADRYATAKAMAMALEAAVPPVKRSAVADWVQENAGDTLQRRMLRVASVESDAMVPAVVAHSPHGAIASGAYGTSVTDTTALRVASSPSHALSHTTRTEIPWLPRLPRWVPVASASAVALLLGAGALWLTTSPLSASVEETSVTAPAIQTQPSIEIVTTALLPPPPAAPAPPTEAAVPSASARVKPARAQSIAPPAAARPALPTKSSDRIYKRD